MLRNSGRWEHKFSWGRDVELEVLVIRMTIREFFITQLANNTRLITRRFSHMVGMINVASIVDKIGAER